LDRVVADYHVDTVRMATLPKGSGLAGKEKTVCDEGNGANGKVATGYGENGKQVGVE
jgi:hypothetical protein